MARLLAWVVRGYQRMLSPLLPSRCRFYPSCSEYARQALHKYGALRGGWLTLKRLVKCGPWHPGGNDPLP
ncbi:MAG: membrane protein insertion efficiency factor YidD [Candidatus Bipolaricaulota bacterium]